MRPPDEDRALCLHEAAHAVTAEALRPGCVIGIQMDYVPGIPDVFWGVVHGADTEALCNWKMWDYGDPHMHAATAAGREGEKIAGLDLRFDDADSYLLRRVARPEERAKARRMAARLVRKHELAVRRVAKALAEHRILNGDEIRRLIAG